MFNILKLKFKKKQFLLITFIIIILKIIIMGLFSSDYQNLLFIPFINCFKFNNPWEYVYTNHLNLEFPYHPIMLYVYSIGIFFINIFHLSNIFLTNIIFKLPTLIADITIFFTLCKMYKSKKHLIILGYFLSPIIIYSGFMHSQLDLLPVALLFLSVYALKKQKILKSAFFYGLALSTKLNALLILPIIIIYLFKNKKYQSIIKFVIISAALYLFFILPYVFSNGFQNMVLMNDKQNLFFLLSIPIGNVKLVISLFVASLIYFRFLIFRKINNDLFDSFIVLTLSLFLLFIPPTSSAWYIWLVPFYISYIIKYSDKTPIRNSFIFLNIFYLLYFVFCHIGDLNDLSIISNTINLKINNELIRNTIFTLLETALLFAVYLHYKIGVKSNAVYRDNQSAIIGISGDSGTGKSSLLQGLKNIFNTNLITLEGDGTHKWERGDDNWTKFTHLNPKANYLYEQVDKIKKLKKLETITYREYNHSSGKFEEPKIIKPKPFIILSGLHTFYLPAMRKLVDLKIYLDPDERLYKFWKIKRDVNERNYSVEQVLSSIENRTKDSLQYIKPQKNFADLIIKFFTDDDFDFTNLDQKPVYKLRLDLSSNINIEKLINYLKAEKIDFNWDYTNNLNFQYLEIISQVDNNFNCTEILYETVANIDEIVSEEFSLPSGLNSIVFYIILHLLSEKMKDKYGSRDIN